jgi:transposase
VGCSPRSACRFGWGLPKFERCEAIQARKKDQGRVQRDDKFVRFAGVRVERVERLADGTWMVHVVTADAGAATCPSCGVVSRSVKERTATSPNDIPYGENGILVRWCKTGWRCQQASCEVGSFTESIPELPPRARTTRRLRAQIGSAMGYAARSVSEVAAAHRVSWPTAHRAFIEHAKRG